MQNDLQAMARCHRIGQSKDVTVFRLVCKDTYEQTLFNIASRKYGQPLCSLLIPLLIPCIPFSLPASQPWMHVQLYGRWILLSLLLKVYDWQDGVQR